MSDSTSMRSSSSWPTIWDWASFWCSGKSWLEGYSLSVGKCFGESKRTYLYPLDWTLLMVAASRWSFFLLKGSSQAAQVADLHWKAECQYKSRTWEKRVVEIHSPYETGCTESGPQKTSWEVHPWYIGLIHWTVQYITHNTCMNQANVKQWHNPYGAGIHLSSEISRGCN